MRQDPEADSTTAPPPTATLDPGREQRLRDIAKHLRRKDGDDPYDIPAWKRAFRSERIPGQEPKGQEPVESRPELEHLRKWRGETPVPVIGTGAMEDHYSEKRRRAVDAAAAQFGAARPQWNEADVTGPMFTVPREIKW